MLSKVIKRSGILLLSMIFVGVVIPVAAFADDSEGYKIDSVRELKQELNRYDSQNKLTENLKKAIMEDTDPVVVDSFTKEKEEKMVEELNKMNLDSLVNEKTGKGKEIIDLGDGCSVIVEVEEGEEKSTLVALKDLIFEPIYAATNGEQMWKAYGNRYFTAKVTTLLGAGTCQMTLENHYNLSSSGIKERYGVADAVGLSATTSITAGDAVITDSTATTPGASDVNMYAKYQYESELSSGNFRINTTVGYVDKDSTRKQIKVKHSWSWQ